MEVKLTWIVTSTVQNLDIYKTKNILFNIRPIKGFAKKVGINPNDSLIPFYFDPTNVFYTNIRNFLKKKLDLNIFDKKFPFELSLGDKIRSTVNFKVQIFPPNILTIKITCKSIKYDNLEDLFKLQNIQNHKNILFISKYVIGVVNSLDHKSYNLEHVFKAKPIISINNFCTPNDFSKNFQFHRKLLIGILIRNRSYQYMSEEIENKIINKNAELNKKNESSLALVDKQGILIVNAINHHQKNDYTSLEILFELGLVFNCFIDEYNRNRISKENFVDFLLLKINKFINRSKIILNISLSNTFIWKIIEEEFLIKEKLEPIVSSESLNKKSKYFDEIELDWWYEPNPEVVISDYLSQKSELSLNFITDIRLKEIILSDLYEAEKNFKLKNYKSTLILCGAIVEAILRDVYLNDSKIPANIRSAIEYETKDFSFMINNLVNYNLLANGSPLLYLLNSIRQYRNLIHPAVTIRLAETADENKAQIGLNIIKLIINHFTKKYAKNLPE